jgi:hypothetical protein
VSFSRPVVCVAALAIAGMLVACKPGTKPHAAASSAASSPSVPAGSPSSPKPATGGCPSAAEIVTAMNAKGWTGFRVNGHVVCDGDWATAPVRQTAIATDPARAVFRRAGGRLRALTYGTDGLCDAPGMAPAPPKIKRALGAYC